MRTATPFATCSSITDWAPCATSRRDFDAFVHRARVQDERAGLRRGQALRVTW